MPEAAEPASDLPPKPLPPVNYDCCGGGCADCEFRLYERKLEEWRELMEAAGRPIR